MDVVIKKSFEVLACITVASEREKTLRGKHEDEISSDYSVVALDETNIDQLCQQALALLDPSERKLEARDREFLLFLLTCILFTHT